MSKYKLTFHQKFKAFEISKYKEGNPSEVDLDAGFYDPIDFCWDFKAGDELVVSWTGDSNLTYLVFKRKTPYEAGESHRELPFKVQVNQNDVAPTKHTAENNPCYQLHRKNESIILSWNDTVHAAIVLWSFDFYWDDVDNKDKCIDPELKIAKAG